MFHPAVAARRGGRAVGARTLHVNGYFRADADNARSVDPDGFYRSGDVVRQVADGNLQVVGRLQAGSAEGDRLLPVTCPPSSYVLNGRVLSRVMLVSTAKRRSGLVNTALFGLMTIIFLALAFALAAIASVYTRRLARRPTVPISEEVGSSRAVVRKLRKREPMSHEEWDYARQVVTDRSSLMAFCIPGALFCLGGFYVFGSLQHLHGATPSERTFLGVIPMLTSTNLAFRLVSSARLKRRFRQAA